MAILVRRAGIIALLGFEACAALILITIPVFAVYSGITTAHSIIDWIIVVDMAVCLPCLPGYQWVLNGMQSDIAYCRDHW